MEAVRSPQSHLCYLDHSLAELFYLIFTVQDIPEIVISPVLKQKPRYWRVGEHTLKL